MYRSQSGLTKDTSLLPLTRLAQPRLARVKQIVWLLSSDTNTCTIELTDAIAEDWGGAPFVDLKKGWDYALKQYPEVYIHTECSVYHYMH